MANTLSSQQLASSWSSFSTKLYRVGDASTRALIFIKCIKDRYNELINNDGRALHIYRAMQFTLRLTQRPFARRSIISYY